MHLHYYLHTNWSSRCSIDHTYGLSKSFLLEVTNGFYKDALHVVAAIAILYRIPPSLLRGVRHDDFHSLLYVHLQSVARPTYLWFSLENEKRVKFVPFFLPLQNAQKDRHNYKVAANFSSCRLFAYRLSWQVLDERPQKSEKLKKLKKCEKDRQIEFRHSFTNFLRFVINYSLLAKTSCVTL